MPRKRTVGAKAVPERSGGALVRIDDGPIRERTWAEHERLERRVDCMRIELERHFRRDIPRYRAWLRRCFGDLVTRLEEARKELEDRSALWEAIRVVAREEGVTSAEAYRLVMARGMGARRADDADDGGVPFDEFMERMDDEFFDRYVGATCRRREHEREIREELARRRDERSRRVRDLYRGIVRLLHPDRWAEAERNGRGCRAGELWLRAQGAYRRRDVGSLELILARCERLRGGDPRAVPVSLIRALAGQLAREAEDLRRRLARCRRDPAWRFTQRARLGAFARERAAALRREMNDVERRLRNVRARLDAIEQR